MWWHSRSIGVVFVLALACGDGNGGAFQGDCFDDEYGAVLIELQRSAAAPASPFPGTAKIAVFLQMDGCLLDFYAQEHPEYQQDGMLGAPVFEAWGNECLCERSYAQSTIACTVQSIDQTLNTQGAVDSMFLRVVYDVLDDGIEGYAVPVGPFPLESTAGCNPLVTLAGGGVQGYDAMDNLIWQVASFDNPTAKPGQSAPIRVFVEP